MQLLARRSVRFGGIFSTSRLLLVPRPHLQVSRRTYYSNRPQWTTLIKTAAYTAGGVAIITVAWPVLRFVVIGGLGYLAYRAIRAYFAFRNINRMLGTQNVWEQVQQMMGFSAVPPGVLGAVRTHAVSSLRTAVGNDARVQELLGGVAVNAGDVDLGDAMDVQAVRGQRVEALFPVFVGGRGSSCFVQTVWAAGRDMSDYRAKETTVWARQPNGDIVNVTIDPVDDTCQDNKRKSHVEDADYRDL
ncbi:hypothetical protein IWW50_003468 [Coemansia erecta]|nr:hypothetical protein GGF43_004377 [Coemansia sp. RSA 2618]KAJ2824149.1 hypothetical protein IWW50_003468 [Coemansia erecta]